MSEVKLNVICILGGPGSGKTTLSIGLMNKVPNSIVLKSGSLIKAFLNHHANDDCKHLSVVMEKGGLIDDKIVSKIVNEEINKIISRGSVHTVILDGYPRTAKQLENFDRSVVNLCALIVLEAPDLILEKRCKIRNLKIDRVDDLQQPVTERIQDFRNHIERITSVTETGTVRLLKLNTCGSIEDTFQNAVTFALQLNL